MNKDYYLKLLTIVIPTRNRAKFLHNTLYNLLNDLEYYIEIIIIDGNSADNTKEVVDSFILQNHYIKYFKLIDGKGFDFELDFGIKECTTKYCWMFSDDDLVSGKDVNKLLNRIQILKDYDLILINSSIYNVDFTKIISDKFIETPDCEGNNANDLFDKFISYLSFFGGCIINRNYWISSNAKRYFGSLFVHIGVIFSTKNINWYWINDPIIKIRYGNASWSNNALEIWLTFWPNLLTELHEIDKNLIQRKIKNFPYTHLKKFIFFKALGVYDKKKAYMVFRSYNIFYLNIVILIVSIIPKYFCFLISYSVAYILNKKVILYDLKHIN